MGALVGTIGRTLAFWAVMAFALALMRYGGDSDTTIGTLGLVLFFAGPFLSYYRTMVVARERERHDAELQANAIAEGIRRAREQ